MATPQILRDIRDDRRLSAYGKLAYLMLTARLPNIHPSMKLLAEDMGVSESTARRAVRELEWLGVLKVTERWTDLGDRDANAYEILPVVSQGQDRGVSQAPPVVSGGHPKNTSTTSSQGKGEISLASRHARPAVRREQAIELVRHAVARSYGQREAEDLYDGQCVALWLLLVGTRRPAKPIPYLCKIFDETPYLDTHLANAGTEEDWNPGGAFAA